MGNQGKNRCNWCGRFRPWEKLKYEGYETEWGREEWMECIKCPTLKSDTKKEPSK